ncbi:hypothetical protein [Salmonella enterica]|uniref:hypothetical protein n=1 Tax=Salmonella enterica TaxID=28901 RepID=UPI002155B5BA|nr:hypothetical protein [Salmonella enterica]
MMIENDKEKSLNDATPPEVQNDIRSESTEKSKEMGRSRYSSIAMIDYFNAIERLCKEKEINPENIDHELQSSLAQKRCWRLVCKVTGDVRGVPEVC